MKLFLIQLATVAIVGGGLGWILGSAARNFRTVAGMTTPFLQFAQWIPFFITWALPIWPPREPYVYTFIFLVWALCCLVLAISILHRHVILRTVLNLDRQVVRTDLLRQILLKAFFICLISQVWLYPYGWFWFAMYEPNWVNRLLVNFFILLFGLALINLVLPGNFDQTAERHWMAVQRQYYPLTELSSCLVLFGACILVWYYLGDFLNELLGLPPPVEVFAAVGTLALSLSSSTPGTQTSVAYHLGTSLAEVVAGVSFAAGLAFVITKFSTDRPTLRRAVSLVTPYTYVVPVLTSLFAVGWPRPLGIGFGVALISIYPCMEVMWRSAYSERYHCIAMAIREALPFAYAGMFFGETMFSTVGTYIAIISARSHQATVNTAVALALLVYLSYLIISSLFQWIYRRGIQAPEGH